jgi:hypothetical protein
MYSLHELIISLTRSERTDLLLLFDLKTLESKTKPRGETGLYSTYLLPVLVRSTPAEYLL